MLRNGDRLEDAVADVAGNPEVETLLLNCCSPEAVTAGLGRLSVLAGEGIRFGGYANAFQVTTSQWLGQETEGHATEPGGVSPIRLHCWVLRVCCAASMEELGGYGGGDEKGGGTRRRGAAVKPGGRTG